MHIFYIIMKLADKDSGVIKAEFLKSIGNVIRRNRLRKNVSQDELASLLEVNRSSISRYEQGTQEIGASQLPLISIYCDFPMRKYIDNELDHNLYDKFRRIVSVESDRYKRKKEKESKSRKTLEAKIYNVDGKEVYEPVYRRKENRAEAIIECREKYPVKPFSEEEFINFVKDAEKLDFSIIGPSNDLIECLEQMDKKETLKGEVADFVIKELIVKPLINDNTGKDIQVQRLYMLYKAIFDGNLNI